MESGDGLVAALIQSRGNAWICCGVPMRTIFAHAETWKRSTWRYGSWRTIVGHIAYIPFTGTYPAPRRSIDLVACCRSSTPDPRV